MAGPQGAGQRRSNAASVCSASRRTLKVPWTMPWSCSFSSAATWASVASRRARPTCADSRRRVSFHVSVSNMTAIVMHCPALADRLKPLRRVTPWFSTGPLQYGQAFANVGDVYPAGDALSFVDPFTGSGLLAAVRSGAMAGKAAATGQPVAEYLRECRASLRQPFQVAGILRRALEGGWAEKLLPLAPARLLFALTRPK